MKALALTIVLIMAMIVPANAQTVTQPMDMEALQAAYDALLEEHEDLLATYEALANGTEYDTLLEKYEKLLISYEVLQKKFDFYQSRYHDEVIRMHQRYWDVLWDRWERTDQQ